MKLRRAAMLAATYVAAIVVALAVPISQLPTRTVMTTCCCPDPTHCHCPDKTPDHSKVPSMRACHRQTQETIAPQLPSFTFPEVAIVVASPRIAPAPNAAPSVPHAAPAPDEPSGPS